MGGHPQLEPGVTGIVRRGRPHPGPVRATIGADPDQIKSFQVLTELWRWMMLEQHDGGPEPASQVGPGPPRRFSHRGDATSLSDNRQVTRRSSRSVPDTQVPDPFPREAPGRVLPERVINEQLAKRRKVIRGGGRQRFHNPVPAR